MSTVHTFRLKTGELLDITLDIDTREIALSMAARLARSKTGRTQALHGAIKARVIGRRKGE